MQSVMAIISICFILLFTQEINSNVIKDISLNLNDIEQDLSEIVDENVNEITQIEDDIQKDDVEVKFILYTQQNADKGDIIPQSDKNALGKSHFNAKYPTRFIIHGWLGGGDSSINKVIKEAYLNRGNFNIIVVDWRSIANSKIYSNAKNKVDIVGKNVAEFIDFLHDNGKMSFKMLYVIGHSLGAHVAGFAGKNVKKGRINTIIGLDPALPLFSINSPDKRLSSTDADYVETIQTNGGKLGFFDPIGIASFYPNGGKTQPGCNLDTTGSCSHARSYEYFVESIGKDNQFITNKCKNFDEIKTEKCSEASGNLRMGGEPSNYGKAKGIYYLKTNSKKPFGKGNK